MKISTKVASTLTAAVLITGAVAVPAMAGNGGGNGGGNGARQTQTNSAQANSTQAVTPAALTPDQTADLVYWVEEEKVARDLYLELARQYPDLSQFANIAKSEQKHMDAVRNLLATYGIADPTAGEAEGVFSDPALAAMYTDLLNSATTPEAALAAGATVERQDLEDLAYAKTLFTNQDVLRVVDSQLRASQGHLNAFTR
ncbi:MAG: DUF2202 domain-containing protein [Actinobacteria bacterium]|nr:DUF2202 domain-containing protein [Actinomycetota bacterium]